VLKSCQEERELGRSPTGKQIAEIVGDEDIMYIHNASTLANRNIKAKQNKRNDFAQFLKGCYKAMCHIL